MAKPFAAGMLTALALTACAQGEGASKDPAANNIECAVKALRAHASDDLKIIDTKAWLNVPSDKTSAPSVTALTLVFSSNVAVLGRLTASNTHGDTSILVTARLKEGVFVEELVSAPEGTPEIDLKYAQDHPLGINLEGYAAQVTACLGEVQTVAFDPTQAVKPPPVVTPDP
jgi:hypothetical protein